MMRLVIVGASGLIGSAVETAARKAGHEVVGTYATRPRDGLRRFDVTKENLLDVVPDLAAADRVMLMSAAIDQGWVQAHPGESHAVNYIGAIEVASAALSRGAHLIFMSSEAVFGGVDGGHDEMSPPWPVSLYAQQKFKVEERLPRGEACVVRTGSVVGWRPEDDRCAVSNTYRALSGNGARMARDNVLTVTAVEDVAAALLKLAEDRTCGVVHVAAGPPVRRTELADWIVQLSRRGGAMSYRPTVLAEIPAKVGRGWLLSTVKCAAGPRSVVERKVAILDEGN